jgi:phosphoribosylaminoimidazole-succinocarboxamide synthase
LIDEVHTPDSSRYWVLESLRERRLAGREPESLDKEPVRLALAALGYRGDGAPPVLPEQVVSETSARYVSAFERLTGMQFVHADDPSESTLMPMLKELL